MRIICYRSIGSMKKRGARGARHVCALRARNALSVDQTAADPL